MNPVQAGRAVTVMILAALAGVPAHSQTPRRLPGEKYALLVGVRQYDPNELRSLPYAEPDVAELAQVLKDAGYRQVVTLSQTAGTANFRLLPTAANIRTTLKGMLEDREPGDTVLVGLAGHGIQFRGSQESFFCPMDVKLADRATLVSLDEVYRAMERSQAGVKLLLVDACRNDPQSDNSRSRAVVRLESVTRPQERRPPGGVAALFSCSPGERAFEHERLKHGVFYHYVIQGLKGEADLDRDGIVGVEELALFTKGRVKSFVNEEYGFDVRQMPVLRGEVGGLAGIVDLRRSPLPPKSNLFILAVGVSAYRLVPPIEFGASDARDASRLLAEKARPLFGGVETKLLVDEEATRDHVMEGLHWLRGKVTANDVGVFMFSGREGKPVRGTIAFLTVDSGFEDAATTGVRVEAIRDALSGATGRFVFLLDTCRSGAMARPLADSLPNIAVLASARDDEVCFEEPEELRAGLFTHAIKEALSGMADSDRDGLVDLAEVETYVARRVEELCGKFPLLTNGKIQHPVSRRSSGYQAFPLSKP